MITQCLAESQLQLSATWTNEACSLYKNPMECVVIVFQRQHVCIYLCKVNFIIATSHFMLALV